MKYLKLVVWKNVIWWICNKQNVDSVSVQQKTHENALFT